MRPGAEDRRGEPGGVPAGEFLALGIVLAVAAILRLWGLTANGFGNTYYAAAVRSMSLNGHNAFFGAYDPAGFLSVDKPPLALWVQTLSVGALGYSPFALHLPQAFAGVASVALLWRLVRGAFGTVAAFVAALALALTPVTVAVDRSNNLDAWLVLLLLLASGAFLSATRTGRLPPLLWGAAFVGLAFNVKMLAAYVLLPTLGAVCLLGASGPWRRRFLHLLAAAGLLLVTSFAWAFLVDATPPERRPYVGGSQHNRAIELAFGYNGPGRLVGGPGQIQGQDPDETQPTQIAANPMFGGAPGPRRLLEPALAAQALWLLPVALAGIVGSALLLPWRLPLSPPARQTLLWGGWLLSYGGVFSFARGTFHPYYLALLAPPLAALTGIAVKAAADAVTTPGRRAAAIIGLTLGALTLTAISQATLLRGHPAAMPLILTALFGALLASAVVLAARLAQSNGVSWRTVATIGAVGLLAAPMAWCVETLRLPESFAMPLAGPPDARRQEMDAETQAVYARADPRLIAFLRDHWRGERFLLATETAYTASPLIIRTGEPVIAVGGFLGIDPAVSLDQFRQMVRQRQLRYVLLVPGEAWEGGGPNSLLFDWVEENGIPADPAKWRRPENASLRFGSLYDMAPNRNR
jgi:4-amino-4-deoxy-L-arabinose transferase-like glycosyltransferase